MAETEKESSGYAQASKRAVARIEEVAQAEAEELSAGVSRGIARASRALSAPGGTEVEGLLAQANLPELAGDDPVAALALRLDREGDLWRNLALRELARLAWADRMAQGVMLFVVTCDAALGVFAVMSALFGAEHAAARALLLGVAALTLSLGAWGMTSLAAAIRRTQKEVAESALRRADVTELRLHRVGILLAWRRGADATLFQDALARLEREAAAPAGPLPAS